MDDRDVAFPRLGPDQVRALRRWGVEHAAAPGTLLIEEGARRLSFYVVLEGSVEILAGYPHSPETVVVHEAGEFVGDADLLTGRASLVTARVRDAAVVLELSSADLARAIAELPDVSETLLAAFLMRRALLVGEHYAGVKIVGSGFSRDAHHLREFAMRNSIPFTWIDVERDPHAEALLRQLGVRADETPLVIGRNGKTLRNPSVGEFGRYMGLDAAPEPGTVFDLVVVGAGPAGLAAAVYGASEGLTTLILDAESAGGQAGSSSRIENYLGFATGIAGAELARQALLQAQKFGARLAVPQTVTGLFLDGGHRCVVLEDGSIIRARSLVVASGVEYRRLGIPRLEALEGAGVYYAAGEMEARLCGGAEVVVVGGGNSAGQAAVFLARHARRVHVVIRGTDLEKSMSRYLIERVNALPNVTVHAGCEVAALDGETRLEAVHLRTDGEAGELVVRAAALFVFIGAVPHTGWLQDCVALDAKGFVLTGPDLRPETAAEGPWLAVRRPPFFLETSLPGVFAAGDARSGSVKRVASAVGEGAMAVTFVHSHLGALA